MIAPQTFHKLLGIYEVNIDLHTYIYIYIYSYRGNDACDRRVRVY